MNIFAADDEKIALSQLTDAIRTAAPDAQLSAFYQPKELLAFAQEQPCDVAFLDVEMGSMTGVEVAKQLKVLYPKVNIVFVTGYSQYMSEAFKLRASGYVSKPVTVEAIAEELAGLRNPPEIQHQNVLTARCFGTFDVFANGSSLTFERSKTKELLAYLIDRRGSAVTSGELRAVLWEDAETDKSKATYLQMLKKDLLDTLRAAGAESVLRISWNKYAVDTSKISCDYYDYLDNKPNGVRAYNGEYMAQYSWGEVQNVLLRDKKTTYCCKRKKNPSKVARIFHYCSKKRYTL